MILKQCLLKNFGLSTNLYSYRPTELKFPTRGHGRPTLYRIFLRVYKNQ